MADRSCHDAIEAIGQLLEKEGGRFNLVKMDDSDDWLAALEWGKEAPDSDMVGAAAYQYGENPLQAINRVLDEAGAN